MIRRRLSSRCGPITYANAAFVLEGVTVTDLGGIHPSAPWPALVDTGANATVVPISACQELGLSPRDWRKPVGFDPSAPQPRTPVFYVRILVQGMEPAALRVYGVNRGSILLGMDFLSNLVLAIDGRRGEGQIGPGSALKSRLLRLLAEL